MNTRINTTFVMAGALVLVLSVGILTAIQSQQAFALTSKHTHTDINGGKCTTNNCNANGGSGNGGNGANSNGGNGGNGENSNGGQGGNGMSGGTSSTPLS